MSSEDAAVNGVASNGPTVRSRGCAVGVCAGAHEADELVTVYEDGGRQSGGSWPTSRIRGSPTHIANLFAVRLGGCGKSMHAGRFRLRVLWLRAPCRCERGHQYTEEGEVVACGEGRGIGRPHRSAKCAIVGEDPARAARCCVRAHPTKDVFDHARAHLRLILRHEFVEQLLQPRGGHQVICRAFIRL